MKKICPYCGRELICLRNDHKCIQENQDFRIEFIQYNFPDITKENLYKWYIKEKHGVSYIRELTNLDNKNIIYCLKYFNIIENLRSIKVASNLKATRNKYKETCLKKYGDINVLGKKSYVYNIRNETVKEKYGVDNVFQILSQFTEGRTLHNRKISSLNKIIFKLLDELKIKYETEFTLRYYLDNKIHVKYYDIKINNLLIEINSNFFHANPNYYKEDDIINYKGKRIAKQIWEDDKFKWTIAVEQNYNLLVLWEDDIKNNMEYVKQQILQWNN
jgi:hypothetical protein